MLAFPYGYGTIKEIQIWHNNAGYSPGWFLLQTTVTYNYAVSIFRYHILCQDSTYIEISRDLRLFEENKYETIIK